MHFRYYFVSIVELLLRSLLLLVLLPSFSTSAVPNLWVESPSQREVSIFFLFYNPLRYLRTHSNNHVVSFSELFPCHLGGRGSQMVRHRCFTLYLPRTHFVLFSVFFALVNFKEFYSFEMVH
uniref:Secreted protein n=1 Tax=Cacopsylla melanoneura TaxID=428564 RepID=A0A8D8RH07_9HEMI